MAMLKILFACEGDQQRSKTAEAIYNDDKRFEVKSAGVNEVTDGVLADWADYIFVMEATHQARLKERFPAQYDEDMIFNLEIEDHFDYMDSKLVAILQSKFEDAYFLFIEN
ncbi:MAG: protein tyrosine phosphatase [Flammeovirgaceae bacterium]